MIIINIFKLIIICICIVLLLITFILFYDNSNKFDNSITSNNNAINSNTLISDENNTSNIININNMDSTKKSLSVNAKWEDANLKEELEFLHKLDLETRKQFIDENLDLLDKHPELVKDASEHIQREFINNNPNNLKFVDKELQKTSIKENPQMFKYANPLVKRDILSNSENIELLVNVLNSNHSNFKFIGYDLDIDIVKNILNNTNPNNMNNEDLITWFIKSGIISAKGSLRQGNSSYYVGLGEQVFGTDIYASEQIGIKAQ